MHRSEFYTSALENELRKELSDEAIAILDITKNIQSAKGLNFFSDIFKASVRYTTTELNRKLKSEHTINVLIKTEPGHGVNRELVKQQDLFLTEFKIYRDVLKRIKEIVGRQIGPQMWYGSDNPGMIIMEDLSKRGFIMKDRQAGLSFDHCCLVLEQLAKWHAGSVAMHEKDPKLIESFRGGIMSSKCPKFMFRLAEVSLLQISERIEKWTDEKYIRAAEKLKRLEKTVAARCLDVYNYDRDEFCVLNHGDCWVNNIMFRENDDGEPIDALLIDYQMASYSSPAIDLLYFMNTCPEISIKYDKDEVFLDVYLNTLKTTMENIGCETKPPTMEQLKRAIHKRRIYAVFSGLTLYLRMIENKENTEDMETLEKLQGLSKKDVLANANAAKAARKMIPVMDKRGYFD